MSRRQSYPETNRETFSYQEQIKDLKHQIQLKNQQIQDLHYELNNVRKKQSIWHHLDQTYEKVNVEEERKSLLAQNDKLKSQIVSMVNQIERKTKALDEQIQKNIDLKQYNHQLKKLGQKTQSVHKKQLQMLKSTLSSSNQLNLIRKQKQKLQIALSKCDVIAREMEQYYMGQVQKYKKQVQEQKNVIVRLQNSKNILEHELNKKQQEVLELKNKISVLNKNSSILNDTRDKENDFNELFKRQTQQKKWELILSQTKQRYEKQNSQLKDQIRFLLLKCQSMQDAKSCYEGLNGNILTQSKFALSSTSNDSFRFNPNNSFSSSIKESLSRRETGPLRTPSKSSRQCNNLGYLLDRTNL